MKSSVDTVLIKRYLVEFIFLSGLFLLGVMPLWQKIGVVPNFGSVVIYLWTIYRPDLMSRRLFVILGICRDATMGYPIGIGVLELILVVSITRLFRRYVLQKSFWTVFWGYAVFTTLSNCLFWLILSATKGYILPFTGALKPILFNLLAYPILCEVSLTMQQKIDGMRSKGIHG
jgi:rod shape-determining protein MreD